MPSSSPHVLKEPKASQSVIAIFRPLVHSRGAFGEVVFYDAAGSAAREGGE